MATKSTFEKKVAIVTGGGMSDGDVASIGDATCRLLGRRGASVVVADIDEAAARATVDHIKSHECEAIAVCADLTDESQCKGVVDEAVSRWGRVDVLVNSLGVATGDIVTRTQLPEFEQTMAINLYSALFMAKYAIPAMKDGGAIVNVSSVALQSPPASLAYNASKAALEGLSSHIALQFGPDGVRCNTVRPGEVWATMPARHASSPEAAARSRAVRASRCAMPEGGDAWDIAHAIAFLASDEARWITGQVLSVDGGAQLVGPNPQWKEYPNYWKALDALRAQG